MLKSAGTGIKYYLTSTQMSGILTVSKNRYSFQDKECLFFYTPCVLGTWNGSSEVATNQKAVMSRSKNPVLNEKHLKALALIESGKMTLKDVAQKVGWGSDYLYELYEGDTSKAGAVASLFAAECKKIDKKTTQRIKELTKDNKRLAHKVINRILDDFDKQKEFSTDDKKVVGTLMNSLAKASPRVEIGDVSFSYTKGYTPEQLVYEFNRLNSLTEGASDRRAVQETPKGRAGSLFDALGHRSEDEEES